jgi:replication initiation and membrane attachment protein DnaB
MYVFVHRRPKLAECYVLTATSAFPGSAVSEQNYKVSEHAITNNKNKKTTTKSSKVVVPVTIYFLASQSPSRKRNFLE